MCYCNSKDLYSVKNEEKHFKIRRKGGFIENISSKRNLESSFKIDKTNKKILEVFEKGLEFCSLNYPMGEIEKMEFEDIVQNPMYFYKNFISKNKPCIIKNGINHWGALEKWDNHYLIDKMNDKKITVDLTPDGFADSIKNKYFIQPYQETLKLNEFFKLREKDNLVPYIQKQDNNFQGKKKEIYLNN